MNIDTICFWKVAFRRLPNCVHFQPAVAERRELPFLTQRNQPFGRVQLLAQICTDIFDFVVCLPLGPTTRCVCAQILAPTDTDKHNTLPTVMPFQTGIPELRRSKKKTYFSNPHARAWCAFHFACQFTWSDLVWNVSVFFANQTGA